ncbi:serine protease 7-like isoform X2 [Toxorhynchites rutilus septentrionalis]|uniref:serine protease 7-like isoform X2 n=1 Tax=Toxorhynchites rutilus septentrionalis TaxID=329112 RepID=UPI002478E803|nr:serine protease 7-like isoform X2 [Toxorhynchites rutilus septentrionalis]
MNSVLSVLISVLFHSSVHSYFARSCRLPGLPKATGRCVPIEQCRQISDYLVPLQFEPNHGFRQYIEERVCDRRPDGSVHVCCGAESSGHKQAMIQRKSQARQNCRTFRLGQGSCVPIASCPALLNSSLDLQKNYNPTLHLQLTQSFCYQEKGTTYVCCEKEKQLSFKITKKLGWQRCQTPFLDAGKCVPPSRCGLIENRDIVPEVFQAFMVGCDQPNNVRHMCCPEDEVQYDIQYGKQCTTQSGNSGYCTESDRCDDFNKAADKQAYVRNNWCYTSLDQVDYVCCGAKKILKAPEEVFDVRTRAGEDAPACTTPNNTAGRCVTLDMCTPIANILRRISASGYAISPEQATYLRNSICTLESTTSTSYHICCDERALQTASASPTTSTTTTTAATPAEPGIANDIANHPNFRLLDSAGCGRSNLDDKIAFGERAAMYQYTWMAMLIYRSASGQDGPECGGTVINSRYVMTAAHCIDGQIERLQYVRLGEYDTRTDPDCDEYMDCAPPFQRYNVEEYKVHPNFTRVVRSGNDIGLLRMNRNIVFDSDVTPICLPYTAALIRFDPTLYWITGWGLTERLENSPVLMQTRIPSVECSLNTHSICGGFGNGTLHCSGDSGGPMKVQVPEINFRYVQYGIISAGPGCGLTGAPGVSTRVSYFMLWVLDNLRA